MNRTSFIAIAFYLAGTGAAVWMTASAHWDMRLSFLVLPLQCAGHVGWKMLARERSYRTSGRSKAQCLDCNSDIGLYRRLARRRFCCDEHEQTYLAELQEMALTRLRSACIEPARPKPAGEAANKTESHAANANCALIQSLTHVPSYNGATSYAQAPARS